MTTRGEINSNFYQIVNVDGNGAPTSIKTQYITSGNVDNAIHANVADVANSVSVSNVAGIGNIAVLNLDGNSGNILYGNGVFSTVPNVSNVANANFANFAGTAFNVSGSNVSGTVANSNYSAYAGNANVANVANSVAVANVSGIGNIATINLDGNVSNVLHGDGSFGPEAGNLNANYANFAGQIVDATQSNITAVGTLVSLSVSGNITSGNANLGNLVIANYFSGDGSLLSNINGSNVSNVANANYANFAGNALTLANGTSNVLIPVANGNVNISTNGNANIAQFDTNGALFLYPTTSSINALRINSYGNPTAGDVSRIASFRARGNAAAPLSVQPNDNLMRLLAFGYNGSGAQTSSTGSIRANVDNSYVANGANIPIGWNIQVNDTNGGINNQAKVHNFWANGNVTFANSVFVTDNLSVTGNITGNNITGNLSILANGTSNISIPTASSNILISTAGNANIVDIQTQGTVNLKPPPQGPLNAIRIDTYGRSGNTGAQRISSFRYRGNSTAPLSVQPNDATMEFLTVAYNGTTVNTNSLARIQATVDNSYTANTANIPFGWQIQVNDTNGGINNQIKTNQFYSNGAVSFAGAATLAGNLTTTSVYVANNAGANVATIQLVGDKTIYSGITLTNGQYRVIADNVDPSTGYSPLSIGLYSANTNIPYNRFARSRGTEASPAGVVAGDGINVINYGVYGDSGNTYLNVFNAPQATVTGNDGAGNVTANLEFYTFNNGSNIVFTSTNTYASGNFIATGNITGGNLLTGNINANGGNYNFTNAASGSTKLYFQGDKTPNSNFDLYDAQFSVTMSNVDTTTGFSPFRFQQYAPNNQRFGAMYYYRARGTDFFNPGNVVANDKVMEYNFLVNSNNTTTSIGTFASTVTYNDDAGNVGMKFDFNAVGTGTTGYLNGRINLLANITDANNFQANNVTINNSGNNFMKLSTYTEAALTAITGQVGWMAAVTDSGGGGNPNGMIAFWDTSNNRWSYIHDNSAV